MALTLTLTTLPQSTNEEATAKALTANNFYIANELGGIIISKIGQADAWFNTTIPLAREVEYNEGNADLQNKFALIGALASNQVSQDSTKTYLVAWEEQYTIIFG